MSVENKHEVAESQWNVWSDEGKKSFNEMYDWVKANQDLCLHPDGIANTPEHWNTTAWNVAWISADVASGIDVVEVETITA
jgi:hypothetical protein